MEFVHDLPPPTSFFFFPSWSEGDRACLRDILAPLRGWGQNGWVVKVGLVPDSLLGRRAAESQGSGLRRGMVLWRRRQGCRTSAGADTAKLSRSWMEFTDGGGLGRVWKDSRTLGDHVLKAVVASAPYFFTFPKSVLFLEPFISEPSRRMSTLGAGSALSSCSLQREAGTVL